VTLAILALLFATELGAQSPTLQSIRIVPNDINLRGAQRTQHLLVLGRFSDGLERDATDAVRFTIADSRLARVDSAPQVIALGEGETTLTAEIQDVRTTARVRVAQMGKSRPFRFDRDIEAIFTRRGCNSSECHGGVKGRAGFKLSMNALDPREDYRWIVEGGGYQVLTAEPVLPKRPRIEPHEPEKSLVLLKPTAGIPHGGGKRFDVGSADYQTILNWVRAGVPYGESGSEGVWSAYRYFPAK
jgi:hypothetical protein